MAHYICRFVTILVLLTGVLAKQKPKQDPASKETDVKLQQVLTDLSLRDDKIQELELKIQEVTSQLEVTKKTLSGKTKHAEILEKSALEHEEEVWKLNIKANNCKYDAEYQEQQLRDVETTRNEMVKEITQMYAVYRDQEKRIGDCKRAKTELSKEVADLRNKQADHSSCEEKLRQKEIEVINRMGDKVDCGQEFQTQRELLQHLKEVMSTLKSEIDFLTAKGESSEPADELSKCQTYGKQVRDSFEKCLDDWYILLDQNKALEKEKADAKPEVRTAATKVPEEPQQGEQSDLWANCVRDLKLALEKSEVMEDKFTNCKATLDIVRGKLEKTKTTLQGVQESYDEIQEDCGTCDEDLTRCEQERGLLDFEKRGIKMVMDMEEKKRKEAEAKNEDTLDELQLAFQSEAKYRHSFGISVFLLLVVATYHVYQLIVSRVKAYSKTSRTAVDSPRKKSGSNKKKDK